MSQLEITQLALSIIGDKENIDELGSDFNSAAEEECSRWYPTALDEVFRYPGANWFFCRRFIPVELSSDATVANVVNPNIYKYPYVYDYPVPALFEIQWFEHPTRGVLADGDFQYIIIWNETDNSHHMLSTHQIIVGLSIAVTDLSYSEDNYPRYFKLAVAHELAFRIITPTLRNPIKTAAYREWAEIEKGKAAAYNANHDYAARPNVNEIDRYTAASFGITR